MLPSWVHPYHLFAAPPPPPLMTSSQHPRHHQSVPLVDFSSPFSSSLPFYWASLLSSPPPPTLPPSPPFPQPFPQFPTQSSPPTTFFPFVCPPHLASVHAPHRSPLGIASGDPSPSQPLSCATPSSATSYQASLPSPLPVTGSPKTVRYPPLVVAESPSSSTSLPPLPNPSETSSPTASPSPSSAAAVPSPPSERRTPPKRARSSGANDAKRERDARDEKTDVKSSSGGPEADDDASTVRDQRTYKRYKKIAEAHPIVRKLIDENKELRALLRVSERCAAVGSVALVRMRSVDPVYIVCVSAPAYACDKDATDRIARKRRLLSTATAIAGADDEAASLPSSGDGVQDAVRPRKSAVAPRVEILLYVYEAHDRRLYFGGPEVALALGLGKRNRAKMSQILAIGCSDSGGGGGGGGADSRSDDNAADSSSSSSSSDHCKIFVRKPRDVGRANSDPVTCAAVHTEKSRMTPPQTTWGLAFPAVRRIIDHRKRSNDRAIFETASELEQQLLAFPTYRKWATATSIARRR